MTVSAHPSACVRKFLDLSMIHVKPTTCGALRYADHKHVWLEGHTGFMIWVPPVEQSGLHCPPELSTAFTVARTKYPDVDYLMFDADAPENPDFPAYEELW